jgi:uncharacterized protein YktB (UPF0637 family)
MTISKKLFDFSILIDEKESHINDWLSVIRNKLEENADWYQTSLQEKAYVRTHIEEDAIRHLFSRFRKNLSKSFLCAKEILKELEYIFDDSNKRVNFMKTFRRLNC